MSNKINIDGSDDPSYRYKMPRLESKVEGRGNGVKTILVNCADLSQALNRSQAQVTKFFGCELGAMTNYDDKIDRALINGAFENKMLQDALTTYIEKFILCPQCRNPETVQEMKGKKKNAFIVLNCKACGATSDADNGHKLVTFLIKEMSQEAGGASKKELRRLKKIEKSKKKNDDDSKSNDDSVSDGEKKKKKKHSKKDNEEGEDGKEKVKKKHKSKTKGIKSREDSEETKIASDACVDVEYIVEELGAMTVNDVETMNSAVVQITELIIGGIADSAFIVRSVEENQSNGGLRRADRIPILFFALVNPKVPLTSLIKHVSLLNSITNGVKDCFLAQVDVEIELLICLEEAIVRTEEGASRDAMLKMVPIVLKMLYDEDLIDEKRVFDWYNGKLDGSKYKHLRHVVDPADLQVIKVSAKPIVDWLQDADTDSDDDDE